jgi:hypothetical protein
VIQIAVNYFGIDCFRSLPPTLLQIITALPFYDGDDAVNFRACAISAHS